MNNYIITDRYHRSVGQKSLGMTSKYFKDNYWYKQNLRGYEGLSEEVCSLILKNSNINDYVQYEQCMINGKLGCRSKNMLQKDENLITFTRLYALMYGADLKKKIECYSILEDKVQFVKDVVFEFTGIDCSEYLSNALYFDMLTLNVDRHFGNLALIEGADGEFRTAPLFDFGASFFSMQHVFKKEMTLEEKYKIMTPQPFANDFELQARLFGECKIKINYDDLEKDLEQVEGLTDDIRNIIERQLNRYKDIFRIDNMCELQTDLCMHKRKNKIR